MHFFVNIDNILLSHNGKLELSFVYSNIINIIDITAAII